MKDWMLVVIGGFLMSAWALCCIWKAETAPIREDLDPVPAPEASAGPSAPLDNHGCYVEPDSVRIQREAYAGRRKNHRSKRAIEELIRNVGRN